MPRYVVERVFSDGLQIPVGETGAKSCLAIVESNLAEQVTWIFSYVSTDKKKTFCVYHIANHRGSRSRSVFL